MKGIKTLRSLGFACLVALIVFYSAFPFYWAVVTSLKSGSALFVAELFPAKPSFSNYIDVFRDQSFGRNILNSVLTASLTVLLSLASAIPASYALARTRFRGRRALLLAFLAISMFPQVAVLSGTFELIRALGLYNTWEGLSLAYVSFTLPFTVWVLTSFMREIPKAIEEAAIMDGAGVITRIFSIYLPLLAPAVATTAMLGFIAAWNEFLFALTLTLSDRARTVPVAISQMSGASQHELPWGNIMAASVTVTLPLILLVLVLQRKIVSGLTAGSVKG